MFKFLLTITLLLVPTLAYSQSQRNPCFINVNGGCTPVGTNDPLPVDATVTATANTVAKATATPPTYAEGSTDSLSMDLNGGLRISGTINAESAATATVAAPTYVEGTINPLSQNLSGDLRVTAKQNGPWIVTAEGGTNLNTSALALESGGNLQSLVDQIGAVTANPTANTVLDRLKTINTTLGSPFQAGASIGNTAFGISGTLPAFASTPTFNLGTLNGAATASNQTNGDQKTQIVDSFGDVIGSTNNALDVNCVSGCSGGGGGGGTSSNFNSTFPTAGTAIGLSDGTDMVPASSDGSGNLKVSLGASLPAGSNAIGSITNSSFASTQSGTWNINNITGTVSLPSGASSSDNQTNGNQKAQIVDGSGNVIASTGNALNVAITSGGGTGGTSSNFNSAFPSVGTAIGMSEGGDMVALTGTSGNLNVQCANCSGSGASASDEASFTAGASVLAPGGGFYQTTATSNPLTDGQQGMWQMTANRAGFVNLRNASGTEIGTPTNPVRIDPTGSTTQPISGTVTANAILAAETTKVIGTVRNLGNSGAVLDFAGQNASSPANAWLIGGQFNSSPTTITNGNSSPLQLDSSGNLKVNLVTGGSSGTVAQGSSTSGQLGNLTQGAVTTSAPTYSTGTTNPLSIDTSGNLRVSTGTVTVTATNLSTNTAQINGVTPLMGNGATGTGSQRVTVANDSAARAVGGEGAVGSAAPSGAVMSGARSGANMVELTQASASVPINVSTATTTQLVALSGGTQIRVTSFDVIAGGTGNITFVYGTGTNCGTGTTPLTGTYPLTAQAGIAKGSGLGPILTVPSGNALCVTTSAAVQMSGSVSYTQY